MSDNPLLDYLVAPPLRSGDTSATNRQDSSDSSWNAGRWSGISALDSMDRIANHVVLETWVQADSTNPPAAPIEQSNFSYLTATITDHTIITRITTARQHTPCQLTGW